MEARFLNVSIDRPLEDVYEFLVEPANFARWAGGLDLEQNIRFAERNEFGVADHSVYLPDGNEVYVPLRAIRNGDGAEVVLTFFRQPGMTDEEAERDAGTMRADLLRLKEVLEG